MDKIGGSTVLQQMLLNKNCLDSKDSQKHSPVECSVLFTIALRENESFQFSTSLALDFTFSILNVLQWLWSFMDWSHCVLAWLVWAPWGWYAGENHSSWWSLSYSNVFSSIYYKISNYLQLSWVFHYISLLLLEKGGSILFYFY